MKIGFAGLGRIQFDMEEAGRLHNRSAQALQAHFKDWEVQTTGNIATTPADAERTARELLVAGTNLLVLQLATFTDASLVAAFFTAFGDNPSVPVILWALPEPSMGVGDRLRLNSLCGVNLAAYTLTSTGRKFKYVYGLPETPGIFNEIELQEQAVKLDKMLRSLKIGVVGSRPPGFYPSGYDELKLWREVGAQLQIYNLQEVFGAAGTIALTQTEDVRAMLRNCLNGLDDLPEQVVCTASNTYQALQDLAARDNLGALAVKCWPEFFTEHQAAACGVLAALMENGLVAACEADVHGAVTMKLMHSLTKTAPFLADLVAADFEKNTFVLWHCGNAAFSLAAEPSHRQAGVHANRKIGVTAQFPLKPGRVTVARLSYSQGKYRLMLGMGEALESPLLFNGNTAEIKPDGEAKKLLDTVIYGGFEHHMVMIYGNVAPQLAAWAEFNGMDVINI
jgi:L-fucose isomerase-like protein